MEIIGVIVAGIIIGFLRKWVAPGDRDKTPFWPTILCGIAGVIVGWYVAAGLGVEETGGVDWIRWIVSVLVAAVFVMGGRDHQRPAQDRIAEPFVNTLEPIRWYLSPDR